MNLELPSLAPIPENPAVIVETYGKAKDEALVEFLRSKTLGIVRAHPERFPVGFRWTNRLLSSIEELFDTLAVPEGEDDSERAT